MLKFSTLKASGDELDRSINKFLATEKATSSEIFLGNNVERLNSNNNTIRLRDIRNLLFLTC